MVVPRFPAATATFLLGALMLLEPLPVLARQQATAFVDVTVVTMNGDEVLPGRTVVVDGGMVVALGRSSELAVPAGARRIEGRGRWLAPGLVDAHVHLFSRSDLDLYLANGITTIVNLGGYGAADSILGIRRSVLEDRLLAPTIYTSGNWVDGDPPVRSINTVVRDTAAARAEVRREHEAGYDFVKVYSALSPQAYHAVLSEAGRLGMPVAGHVPQLVGVESVLGGGQENISHAGALVFNGIGFRATDAQLERLARRVREAGASVTTTLWMAELAFRQRTGPDGIAAVAAREEMRHLPPERRRAWREDNMFASYPRVSAAEGRKRVSLLRRFVAALVEAGVPVLAGTDSDVAGSVPGFAIHEELRSLAASGLEPYEVLRSATAAPAAWLASALDLEAASGVIEVGARADLLLLDQNPLDDLETLRRPAGVMVRGRWLGRDRLERLLAPRRTEETR